MNKKIAALLAAMTLLGALTACGAAPESTAPQPTEAKTDVPAITEAVTETATEDVFQEIVLADDENCTVKITAMGEDSFWGYSLKVFLENKTDLELMYTVDNVSVNGFMCDPFWATTVAAGKKANDEISFMDSDFEKNGITDVEEITFTLRVYDSNDWLADNFVEETFTINP